MLIHLGVICTYFHTKMAELSRCNREHMACMFTIYRKSLLTPALKYLSDLLWSNDQLVLGQEVEPICSDIWLSSFVLNVNCFVSTLGSIF